MGSDGNGEGPRSGVLFDVDGTLADTNYLHTLAWSRAIEDVGEWAPMNAIHRLVGMGGEQLIDDLFGRQLPGVSDARVRRYRELIHEARAFPEAAATLSSLHRLGVRVVLATSAPGEELAAMRQLLDADAWIDAATSADDVEGAKPAPDVFLAALRAGDVDPARALVVGDSVWDVQAARAAGLACVGVETGGFSAHELREAGAIAVHRDVAELHAQLRVGPLAPLLDRTDAASPGDG
jgi:HAD superfamily hydrolase (TIGR01509 family)